MRSISEIQTLVNEEKKDISDEELRRCIKGLSIIENYYYNCLIFSLGILEKDNQYLKLSNQIKDSLRRIKKNIEKD